jgi:hypothetical protein
MVSALVVCCFRLAGPKFTFDVDESSFPETLAAGLCQLPHCHHAVPFKAVLDLAPKRFVDPYGEADLRLACRVNLQCQIIAKISDYCRSIE